ncbi:uncharacterized protein LOC132750306 [Ruditapes philippinarum]|uniref:uncharacterized protein LOC132750306 n=1 Tax=Ruditapes philippinarum TaxID=129788 RepID=UPI00295B9626|nr:uncharacterized protein LOC132750306 [Ruditapes philippinarum]
MTSYRKFSGKQRGEHDEPPSYNIRFDYSNTYLDNEDLDNRLENQAYELHREQFRRGVETDKMLKETKQNADEMLQLKNAIKNRDPYESSNRVSSSADLKRKPSSKQLRSSASVENDTIAEQSGLANDANTNGNIKVDEVDGSQDTEKKIQSKPLNTLTMFLLSLQTFKRNSHQRKPDTHKPHAGEQHPNANIEHSHARSTTLSTSNQIKRPSSYHSGDQRLYESGRHRTETDKTAGSQYGIHVRKDHTRSRRKLEELSKLEQDSKYGYVDKYEERRKKLLASCKDTKTIDDRIQTFLKDVDEFKSMASEENSLEKVLMRSKSARFTRVKSFAW